MHDRSTSLTRNNAIIVFFAALVAAGISAHLTTRLPDVPATVPVVAQGERSVDGARLVVTASMPWRP